MDFFNFMVSCFAHGVVRALDPMPSFPRASRWAGDVASFALRSCRWLALPLGPLEALPSYFVDRKYRVERAMMSTTHRVLCGMLDGLFNGLYEAAMSSRRYSQKVEA